jgi:hypothetical protein
LDKRQLKKEKHFFLIISLSLFLLIILPLSDGKTGYSINVKVNNSTAISTFSWSRSTVPLTYMAESACSGYGNSSKYVKIEGQAGIGIKETTYARKGRMINKDVMKVASTVNRITINEAVSGEIYNVTDDIADSGTKRFNMISDRYSAEINDSIPTILLDQNEMYYRGEGINTRNEYKNNGDNFVTNYYATSLTKSVAYAAVYNNELLFVDMVPGKADVFVGQNFSSALRLSSASDRYSGFGFASGNEFMEGTYLGSFNIDTKITKVHEFKLQEEPLEELECCNQGYDAAQNMGYIFYPLLQTCIQDLVLQQAMNSWKRLN